jgi:hypothetical protein
MNLRPFFSRLGSHRTPAFSPEEAAINSELVEFHPCATDLSLQRLRRFAPFNALKYLQRHPDVANSGADPYLHYMTHGFCELREQDVVQIARQVGRVVHEQVEDTVPLPCISLATAKVEVLCSSRGNSFMRPLGLHLAHGLSRCGADVIVQDENSDLNGWADYRIIVAPHEFFHAGCGEKWNNSKVLANTLMLSTEQIQTQWYWTSLPYLLMSRGVIDLFPHSVNLLNEAGVPSIYFAPNPAPAKISQSMDLLHKHPLFTALPEDAKQPSDGSLLRQKRAIDITFFGTSSSHRSKVLARCAPYFAELESFIYYRQIARGPLEKADGSLSLLAEHVSRHSKICLNIHRDHFGSFEWQRIVELGMCSGALVVSEPCLRVPDIVPGEHYIEVESKNMGEMLAWLLNDSDGQKLNDIIRHNASQLVAKAYEANTSACQVAAFLKALP